MKMDASVGCFHCGEKVRETSTLTLTVFGKLESFCCRACLFAAETILNSGLSQYYLSRTESVAPFSPGTLLSSAECSFFDNPDNLSEFSSHTTPDERSTLLTIEGIHCAACGWLIKNRLLPLDGVTAISVNPASQKAQLSWQPQKIHLSRILNHLAELGYKATPLWLLTQNSETEKHHKKTLRRLGVAGIGMMQVMMFSIGLYAGAFSGIDDLHKELLRWVSLLISSCVLLYSGPPFFISAFKGLKAKTLNMDVPIALTIGSTYLISIWATLNHQGEVYFDAVTMFIFFLTLGRFLEASGRHKANQSAQALLKCLPHTAIRLLNNGNSEVVSIHTLQAGEKILIKPGTTIPVDGRIVTGESSVDESLLTGEMNPKQKQSGDQVLGGSQNVDGILELEVTHRVQNSLLSNIMQLMERGLAEKPDIAVIADKVASYFIGVLLLVAACVFIVWCFIDADRALWITLSVLVISCPCALSLATPIALTAASNALMKKGVLITRSNVIEKLAQADSLIFDKTGTLTQGRFFLQKIVPLSNLNETECLELATLLEKNSEHPISVAFKQRGELSSTQFITDIKNVANQGMEGEIKGQRYRIGKASFSAALYASSPPVYTPAQSLTTSQSILLSSQDGPIAWFEIEDSLRPGVIAVIENLHARHLNLQMLSGDPSPSALALAHSLDFDSAYNNYSPTDKMAFVQQLQQKGHHVIMVGDGINDAPVLAQANISFAMGSGTDLAKTSADIVLLNADIKQIPVTLDMAQRTLKIIRQNTTWAIVYNALALPLAALGYVEPYISTIGMSVSSLVVVLNSLRLHNDR